MVKIVFYKSSSRYYDQACLISETFNNYSNINDQNIIQIDIDEINEKRKEFKSVCDIIKNWHKTEYFINKKKVNKYEIEKLLDVIDCARYNNNEDDEYCYSDCGWDASLLIQYRFAIMVIGIIIIIQKVMHGMNMGISKIILG